VSDLHKILTKALNDPKFAHLLQTDVEGAMKHAGVEVTPEKVAALKNSVESLSTCNQYFGGEKPY